MEYNEMLRERLDNWERERDHAQLISEARRVGAITESGPRQWLDGWLIRASKGAEQRRERREVASNRRGIAS
ncbi:MAG: hypothetical protein ABI577_08890 [bacterium]